MEDFFADLYDDEPTEDGEPSFSLYEFRKWLSKQKDDTKKLQPEAKSGDDDLKKEFRDRVKKKREKKKED
jgi:hypothetical protein